VSGKNTFSLSWFKISFLFYDHPSHTHSHSHSHTLTPTPSLPHILSPHKSQQQQTFHFFPTLSTQQHQHSLTFLSIFFFFLSLHTLSLTFHSSLKQCFIVVIIIIIISAFFVYLQKRRWEKRYFHRLLHLS